MAHFTFFLPQNVAEVMSSHPTWYIFIVAATAVDVHLMQIQKRVVTGYFESEESADYFPFLRVASLLRDDCAFYSALRLVSHQYISFYAAYIGFNVSADRLQLIRCFSMSA